MPLRPYQRKVLRSILVDYRAGIRRLALVMATGAGKTEVVSRLPEMLKQPKDQQLVFIVNRDDLVEQAAATYLRTGVKVGIERGQDRGSPESDDVVVMSIQSVSRKDGVDARMLRYNVDRIQNAVIDETHFALSQMYIHLLRYLRMLKGDPGTDDAKFLLGITATPDRTDGKGLEAIYDKVTDEVSPEELMRTGPIVNGEMYTYLARPKGFRVNTDFDMSMVRTRGGDFVDQDLEDVFSKPEYNSLILDKYEELGEGFPAGMFATSVKHAHEFAEMANLRGIPAAAVDGSTPRAKRRQIYDALTAGDLRIISSRDVLTYGWDCLDEETEVLTGSGWKSIDSLESIDNTYSLNLQTGFCELVPAQDKGWRPRRIDEKMIHLESQRVNIRVTEGHRMFVRKRMEGGSLSDKFSQFSALELAQARSSMYLPLAASMECFPGIPLTDDEVRLVAWFMTDGGMERHGTSLVICQTKKYWVEIQSLLDRLGLDYIHTIIKRRRTGFRKKNEGTNQDPVHKFSVPLGWRHGSSGWKRYVPYMDKNVSPLLQLMTVGQFRIFWNEALKGDGEQLDKSGWLWCDRKAQVDAYMMMAVTRGLSTSFNHRVTKNGRDVWRVTVRERPGLWLNPTCAPNKKSLKDPVEEIYKPERVWCVTNRLGTLITRRNGRVAIVGNCPAATVALMARPLKSSLLYRQIVGRFLRRSPSVETYQAGGFEGWVKPYSIVIDFCGLLGKHSMVTVPTLFGLPSDFDFKGADAVEVKEEIEQIMMKYPTVSMRAGSLQEFKSQVDSIDVMSPPVVRPDVRKYSAFSWLEIFEGVLQLGTSGCTIEIRQNTLGLFEIYEVRQGIRQIFATMPTLKDALACGDSRVPQDEHALHKTRARWREEPPTEKQCARIYRLDQRVRSKFEGVSDFYAFALQQHNGRNVNYSKGAMSRAIDMFKQRETTI